MTFDFHMVSDAKAVVLLSGGLDSTTALAVANGQGFRTHALSFQYGQRHAVELAAAHRVALSLGVCDHRVVTLDLRAIGGSSLTSDEPVPKGRDDATRAASIPSTYVPARNTIFLSYALAYAEVVGARDIFIGVNALDYSGYPDCRPEYIEAFECMANLATRAGVEGAEHGRAGLKIHTPLIALSKTQIIQLGRSLGVDYGQTWSCYDPAAGLACGECDSCVLRLRGFAQAELIDPVTYLSETSGRDLIAAVCP